MVYLPLGKIFVSWDEYSQYMEKHVPNHQADIESWVAQSHEQILAISVIGDHLPRKINHIKYLEHVGNINHTMLEVRMGIY